MKDPHLSGNLLLQRWHGGGEEKNGQGYSGKYRGDWGF